MWQRLPNDRRSPILAAVRPEAIAAGEAAVTAADATAVVALVVAAQVKAEAQVAETWAAATCAAVALLVEDGLAVVRKAAAVQQVRVAATAEEVAEAEGEVADATRVAVPLQASAERRYCLQSHRQC